MLEMGARFTEDIYIKVSFYPDDHTGVVTAIFGRGEEEITKTAEFNLDDDLH